MPALIAENRRARFEYHIEETYEAGLVLQGWEVKAIRAGQCEAGDDPTSRAARGRQFGRSFCI